jgi:hypothetical protein
MRESLKEWAEDHGEDLQQLRYEAAHPEEFENDSEPEEDKEEIEETE